MNKRRRKKALKKIIEGRPLTAKELNAIHLGASILGYDPAHGTDYACTVKGYRNADGIVSIITVRYH